MKKKLLQKIADLIIKRLETSLIVGDDETFDFFYSIGMQYDAFCITVFDVYLDWKKKIKKHLQVIKMVSIFAITKSSL